MRRFTSGGRKMDGCESLEFIGAFFCENAAVETHDQKRIGLVQV